MSLCDENVYLFRVMCRDIPNRIVTLQERVRIIVSPVPENENYALIQSEEIRKIVEHDDRFREAIMVNGEIIMDPLKQSIKLVELSMESEMLLISII